MPNITNSTKSILDIHHSNWKLVCAKCRGVRQGQVAKRSLDCRVLGIWKKQGVFDKLISFSQIIINVQNSAQVVSRKWKVLYCSSIYIRHLLFWRKKWVPITCLANIYLFSQRNNCTSFYSYLIVIIVILFYYRNSSKS